MKPPVAPLLLALVALSACTSTYVATPGSLPAHRMRQRSQSKSATVVFHSGERVRARLVQVEADTLRWFDAAAGANHATPLRDVQEVRFVRRGKGAGQGLVGGLVAGVAGGFVYGAVTFKEKPGCGTWFDVCTWQANAFWGGIGGAINGIVYGPLVGLVVGSRARYVFAEPVVPAPGR